MKKLLLLLFVVASYTVNAQSTTPIVSISANTSNFLENGSSIFTATIPQSISSDIVVPLTVSGLAKLDVDYTATFPSKGEEKLL